MSQASERIVVVGAGHAGGSVAALLRQYGWPGAIILIGNEPCPPYQRPPLSKAWLTGETNLAALALRAAEFYPTNRIELRLSSQVNGIDRRRQAVATADGEWIAYDHLILALGARPRRLALPGADKPSVLTLRSLADAERLHRSLRPGLRLTIIGGGYIGLEVAASARRLGAEVTVIERERHLLARVASAELAAYCQRRHQASGVRLLCDASVTAVSPDVRLSDGTTIPSDLTLVGVGAVPNDGLAREAGLLCQNGIVVDDTAKTSDPMIHAIGDCTLRPSPLYGRTVRLESVPNALEQAKQAAAALCGRRPPIPEVPWFWSDQYDTRLQMAGLPFDVAETVLRGDPAADAFAVFHLGADSTLQAVEAVNAPAEFMAGKLLIGRRQKVVAARLADMSVSPQELAA